MTSYRERGHDGRRTRRTNRLVSTGAQAVETASGLPRCEGRLDAAGRKNGQRLIMGETTGHANDGELFLAEHPHGMRGKNCDWPSVDVIAELAEDRKNTDRRLAKVTERLRAMGWEITRNEDLARYCTPTLRRAGGETGTRL